MIRVVIDLTDGPQGGALADVSEALAEKIIARAPGRVALVITEAQRPLLPARCAEHPSVRLVVVRDAAAGWVRAGQIADNGAVVISSRRYAPLLHWIAVDWSNPRAPALTPSEGLERWKSNLPLEDVPAAASLRDLSLLLDPVDPVKPPAELTSTPGRLRGLIAALSYGREVVVRNERAWNAAPAAADAALRLAWGRSLDVPVAATEGEWANLLFERAKSLGAGVMAVGNDTEVIAQRAKVARGGSPARAVLAGANLHLVNPTAALRTQMGSLHAVFIHDEAPRTSGFERVRALVRETPWEQWLDDPFMESALARIDPQGADRDELEFARASLLVHDKLRPASAPRRHDWRALLTAVVSHNPPEVAIRVPVCETAGAKTTVYLPHREVDRRASQRGKELVGVRALAPPRITRDDAVVALEATTERVGGGEWNAWIAQRRYLLPSAKVIDDADALVDLFVRAPSRNALTPDLLRWWNQAPDEHQLGLFWPSTPLTAERNFWRDADRHLGMLWIALRRALATGLDTTLHDGTGLLEMGGGHVAEVTACARGANPSGAATEAEFWCVFDPESAARIIDESVIVRGVGTRQARHGRSRVDVTTSVPRRLYLAYRDARLQVTFRATPWEAPRDGSARYDFEAAAASVGTAEWRRADSSG